MNLPGEAWADLVASRTGLLKVDVERLRRLNLLDDLIVATRRTNSPVKAGETVGKAKVRGLVVRQAVLKEAKELAAGSSKVLQIRPYRKVRAGAVITGREMRVGRRMRSSLCFESELSSTGVRWFTRKSSPTRSPKYPELSARRWLRIWT